MAVTGDKQESCTAQQADYSDVGLERARELLAQKDEELALLLHQIEQLKRQLFGPRSSKRDGPIDPKHMLPFPQLRALIEQAEARVAEREEAQKQAAAAAQAAEGDTESGDRKGRKRRRNLEHDLPSHLPRRRRAQKLSDEQRQCDCGGCLVEVREEVSRRLEQHKVAFVEEHVTTYYACRGCEKFVSSAPDRQTVVEGGILGPSFIADFVYQRFGNHTPYNRLQRELEQLGIPVDRSVICRSVLKCGELLEPIYNQIKREVLSSFLVQIDDTPVVVRNGREKGRATGRIWIYRDPIGNVVFDFRMDRSQEGPRAIVGKFEGFIQGDAYSGHDFLFRNNDVRIELGCWAHVVRHFRDAGSTNKKLAGEFDAIFSALHALEKEARAMSPPERFMHRVQRARPVLLEMENWLEARSTTVAPKGPMGKAIAYARNHWQALTNFLLDGRVTDITNNGAERALRRVAVGRKNWMYIGVEEAGKPAAVLMSILQTCVEQDVNAVEYLRDVLVRISQSGSAAELTELTPARWKANEAAKQRVLDGRAAVALAVQSLDYSGGE